MIDYRIMEHGDIQAGLSLCRLAGWNQVARDWEIFLKLSPDGCRVAVSGSKIVGTVTTINYENKFCWVGMVLVDPNYRRQGIGIQLLKAGINILGGVKSIKLDATAAGRQVYLKLGFIDEYPLSRMLLAGKANIPGLSAAQQVKRNDLDKLATFDSHIFGACRHPLLEWMWEGGQEFSWMVEQENEIQGFCMGRRGYHYTHIGPLVAKDFRVAKQLLTTALKNCTGQQVILDVMQFEPEWLQWLNTIGFSEQRRFIRMYKGVNTNTGDWQSQYAILGPEFG